MFCYQPAACRGQLRSFRRNAFHFQIEQGIVGCEKIEKLLQGRNSLGGEFVSCCLLAPAKPTPDIDFLQLSCGQVGDTLLYMRSSLQCFIMNDYGHAIPREPHIELDSIGSRFDSQLKGGERVFRSICRGPAMTNDQGLISHCAGSLTQALGCWAMRLENLCGWIVDHTLEFDVKGAIVALDSTTDRNVSTVVC